MIEESRVILLFNVVRLIVIMDYGYGLFVILLVFRLIFIEMEMVVNYLLIEVIEDFNESFKNIYDNG